MVAASLSIVATATVAANAHESGSRVDIRGDAVAFYPYSNRTLLAADGHVVVRVGRRTIAADALRYDVTAKRLTASGNVRVSGRGDDVRGVAYRLELDSDAAYLVRVEPLPQTFMLQADDMRAAIEGPAPPGTFDMLDLDGERP